MNRLLPAAAAGALAIALCACGDAGDTDRQTEGQRLADAFSPAAEAAAPPAPTAQAFVNAVTANDAYELAAAKLAQQMSRRDAVRNYAAQMIQDHTVVADELRVALKRTKGVAANPQMTSAQQREFDQLQNAGAGFDDDYARQEIATHEQELSLLRDYADNGMDPALSEFAADAENMAADHLRLAHKLA